MEIRKRIGQFKEDHFVQFLGSVIVCLGTLVAAGFALIGQCVARPLPSCPGCTYWNPSAKRCTKIACEGDSNIPSGLRCQELDATCSCILKECPVEQERDPASCECRDRCLNEWEDCREYSLCILTEGNTGECQSQIARSVVKHCWKDQSVNCSTLAMPGGGAGADVLDIGVDASGSLFDTQPAREDAGAVKKCPGCKYWNSGEKACVPIPCPGRCEQPVGSACACAPPSCRAGMELRDDCRCHDRCEGYMKTCVQVAGCMRETGGNQNACNARKNASQAKGCWQDHPGC